MNTDLAIQKDNRKGKLLGNKAERSAVLTTHCKAHSSARSPGDLLLSKAEQNWNDAGFSLETNLKGRR